VRVLPPDLYELVMKDVKNGYTAPPPPLGGQAHGEHQHGDHDHSAHEHTEHANDEGHRR
jgi:hypothetical protein